MGDALPVQGVEVAEYSSGVDHEIVLAVVDEHLDPSEQVDDLTCVTPHDVSLKGVVDIIASWHVVHSIRDSKLGSAVVEQRNEGHIAFPVLPEVIGTHASPELIAGIVVVGQKVEKGSSLYRVRNLTFL